MEHVLVVCGAGASSTFLVHWMRTTAPSLGLDLDVRAASVDELDSLLSHVDAVLIGHHLAPRFDQLAGECAAAGVRVALLPELTFDAAGATTALQTLTHASLPAPNPQETTHG